MLDFKNPEEIAGLIDQTLLHPTATREEVRKFCQEAGGLGFAAVCIAPCWVSLAASVLEESEARICTVVGFPLGFQSKEEKIQEVLISLNNGAEEIDYVVNLGAVKGDERDVVASEMRGIRRAAEIAAVKAILETGHLTREEKEWLCRLAVDQGLDFVKTSTGLGPAGATVADVKLLNQCTKGGTKVKAAGGIRSLDDLEKMVLAGAHRIGTSSGKEIVSQAAARKNSHT